MYSNAKSLRISQAFYLVPQTGLEPVRPRRHRIFLLTTAFAAHINVICSLDYLFTII